MGLFGGDAPHEDYLRLEARVAALESTVARLVSRSAEGAAAADPGQDPAWLGEVRSLKGQGNAILAIKRVREVTGWGLKEAKDYVDGL